MSRPRVKCNPRKSGMHCLLSVELLKKRGQEAGVGPSLGPEVQKKEAPVQTNSDEEQEMQLLEHKKRTLPMFPQLPEQVMLTGKDVNEILSVSFIIEPMDKKPEMRISPRKVMNPLPISSIVPHTLSVA
jgi:hypothetical protein